MEEDEIQPITIAVAGAHGEAEASAGVCHGGHFHIYLTVNDAQIAVTMDAEQLVLALGAVVHALTDDGEDEEGEEAPEAPHDIVDPKNVAPEHRHLLN